MTDQRDGDPAARAIADVERLLAGAKGLQRIVEIARAVAVDENPALVERRGVRRSQRPGPPRGAAAADG